MIESDLQKTYTFSQVAQEQLSKIQHHPTGYGLVIKGVHIHSPGLNAEAIDNNGKLVLDDVIIHNYPGSSNPALINNEGSSVEIKGNCKIIEQ